MRGGDLRGRGVGEHKHAFRLGCRGWCRPARPRPADGPTRSWRRWAAPPVAPLAPQLQVGPVAGGGGSVGVRRGRGVRRSTRAQRGHGAMPRGHPAPAQHPKTQTKRLPSLVQRGATQLFISGIQNRLARGVCACGSGGLRGRRWRSGLISNFWTAPVAARVPVRWSGGVRGCRTGRRSGRPARPVSGPGRRPTRLGPRPGPPR